MPRIAIFGSYGVKDIGDDAMLYQDLLILKKLGVLFTNVNIITRNIPYTKWFLKDLNIPDNSFVQEDNHGIDSAFDWCDVVLLTGGGTLNTRGTKEKPETGSMQRMSHFYTRYRDRKKKIFMSGQTIGPFGLVKREDDFAREVIDYASMTTVRDFSLSTESAKLLGSNTSKIISTVDDAFGLVSNAPIPKQINDFIDPRTIGFNANNYKLTKRDDYVKSAIKVCNTLIDKGYKILFIHQGNLPGHDDIAITKKIWEGINHKSKTLCVPFSGVNVLEYRNIVSKMRLNIGSRYHYLMFSAASNVPYIGICADYYSWIKQIGFSEPLGMSDMIVPHNLFDADAVLDRVENALESDVDSCKLHEHDEESMKLFRAFLAGYE